MMESTNSGNLEKLTSQNHMPNAITTTSLEPPSGVNATLPLTNDQTKLHSNLHETSSINNPFVEAHISPLENNSTPSSLSSSQNPFLLHNDATNTSHALQQENGAMIHSSNDDDMQSLHSSITPSTYESSQGNPFQVPIATTTSSQKFVENHDHVHESSDDDIPISSMPNQGQKNIGSEIQNPPIQVMERSEDSATPSTQRIPLNIFTRNKSNTQWSTASNESLFSIQMGNMSFSNDIFWLNKSSEFDKSCECVKETVVSISPADTNMSGAPQSNQPLVTMQQSLTKFNDISQSSAQQHECSRVTEEKAAETMREVIMETSVTSGNKSDNGNLTYANGATRSSRISSSNDHSHHSDGSTKSFAFKVLTDGEKNPSSKRVRQQQKSQQLQQQQTFQETSNAAQNPISTSNASQKTWLSCFTCCH